MKTISKFSQFQQEETKFLEAPVDELDPPAELLQSFTEYMLSKRERLQYFREIEVEKGEPLLRTINVMTFDEQKEILERLVTLKFSQPSIAFLQFRYIALKICFGDGGEVLSMEASLASQGDAEYQLLKATQENVRKFYGDTDLLNLILKKIKSNENN